MLKVKPTNSDQERVLIDSQTSTSKNNSKASGAQNKEATELLESILYILDKYSVGDAFYHELAMLNDGLPCSYLIKQCRKQMNLIYTVQKTPPIPGAQLEFEIVLRDELSKFLSNPDNAGKQTVHIKICGDGTKVSRIANYVCLSFSLLDDENVLLAKGVHTVAIINASETYENIATGFADVIEDINVVFKSGHI